MNCNNVEEDKVLGTKINSKKAWKFGRVTVIDLNLEGKVGHGGLISGASGAQAACPEVGHLPADHRRFPRPRGCGSGDFSAKIIRFFRIWCQSLEMPFPILLFSSLVKIGHSHQCLALD